MPDRYKEVDIIGIVMGQVTTPFHCLLPFEESSLVS